METYNIAGQEYPVLCYITSPLAGRVPLVDLPLMDDGEWDKLARENAVHNFTRRFGHAPLSTEVAVKWQRETYGGGAR